MSLMSFGQAESEPLPEESAPGKRRRYLIILGMVIALIMAGGSAAYLVLNSSVSANHGPPGAFTPPIGDSATATPGDGANASTSASAALSASTSASHGASPSANPTAKPPAGGGGPGAPGAATYRVATELCPALDTSPVEAVAAGSGSTGGDHTDKSNYVDYTCTGSFGPSGKVRMITEARIFADAASAQASYTNDKVGTEHVSGVGTDATGFLPASGGYVLLAVDGNLEFRIQLNGVGGKPTPGELRQPAIDTTKKSLPRLRA